MYSTSEDTLQSFDGTNLKRRDGERFIVLIQGDEGEEGGDSTVFPCLWLHQRGSVYQHFNLHRLVTDKRESSRHCHHTALERGDVRLEKHVANEFKQHIAFQYF